MSISILKVATPMALASVLAFGIATANAQDHGRRGGPAGGNHVTGGGAFHSGGARMSGPRFNAGGNFGGRANAAGPRPNFANRGSNPHFSANGNNRRYAGNWNGHSRNDNGRWRHRRGWWGPGIAAGIGLGLGYGGYYGYDYPYAYAYDDAPYYYGDVYTDSTVVGDDAAAIAYCQQRYKSYDVRTQTFLGYDGERHPCP